MVLPCGHCISQASSVVSPSCGGLPGAEGGHGQGVAGRAGRPQEPASLHSTAHNLCVAPTSTRRMQISILKIAKGANRSFKCPYCPAECTPRDCQELVFPDRE